MSKINAKRAAQAITAVARMNASERENFALQDGKGAALAHARASLRKEKGAKTFQEWMATDIAGIKGNHPAVIYDAALAYFGDVAMGYRRNIEGLQGLINRQHADSIVRALDAESAVSEAQEERDTCEAAFIEDKQKTLEKARTRAGRANAARDTLAAYVAWAGAVAESLARQAQERREAANVETAAA